MVKALRNWSEGLGIDPRWYRWGFFPKLPTKPCDLGTTQPLKISTRKILGVNRVECREDPGALTSRNPKSHIRLVVENRYFLKAVRMV